MLVYNIKMNKLLKYVCAAGKGEKKEEKAEAAAKKEEY